MEKSGNEHSLSNGTLYPFRSVEHCEHKTQAHMTGSTIGYPFTLLKGR